VVKLVTIGFDCSTCGGTPPEAIVEPSLVQYQAVEKVDGFHIDADRVIED
jgi:hypothetical protein